MKKIFTSIAVCCALAAPVANAQNASYSLPATLSYYGAISVEAGEPYPAANQVTTNPINDGAFIWVPVGSKVMYKSTSDAGATAYSWEVPGAAVEDATAANALATYNTVGTFDFPTLTTTYATGESKYAENLKIKVGGRAELCHSDNREWGKTYGLGQAQFGPDAGSLGGSNNREIAGVGNFYRFSSPEMYVDAVNVYAVKKPENAGDAKISIRAYLPYIGESSFLMMGQFGQYGALEVDVVPMSAGKTSEDGVYLPVKSYAVYTMRPQNPMSCEGYPYLFFAVEGFAYKGGETLTEDFGIATDVMPYRNLTQEEYVNGLAHNSYVRLSSESDYLRPVTLFGGTDPMGAFTGNYKSFNFWICPEVRGAETSAGIGDVAVNPADALKIERDGDTLLVGGAADGIVSIYGANGALKMQATTANGGAMFNISGLTPGVYIVKTATSAAKFVK
ncbi:MAG: T9SS type A sorting domain-containing protein [Clostridium sp.]|nr:T9SS type A sorting domain-containing protein [Clostridium sp.]